MGAIDSADDVVRAAEAEVTGEHGHGLAARGGVVGDTRTHHRQDVTVAEAVRDEVSAGDGAKDVFETSAKF